MSGGQFCYLSTVKDAYTKEILSYQLSQNLKEQFVLDTFRRLVLIHGKELTNETIVHSDQGIHYKAKKFNEMMEYHDFSVPCLERLLVGIMHHRRVSSAI